MTKKSTKVIFTKKFMIDDIDVNKILSISKKEPYGKKIRLNTLLATLIMGY